MSCRSHTELLLRVDRQRGGSKKCDRPGFASGGSTRNAVPNVDIMNLERVVYNPGI